MGKDNQEKSKEGSQEGSADGGQEGGCSAIGRKGGRAAPFPEARAR